MYLCSKFQITNYPNQTLRSAANNHLHIPTHNLEIFRQSISYAGPKLWNSLPGDIRKANTLNTFKSKYIKYKFSHWPDSIST